MTISPADNIRTRIISESLNGGVPVFVGMVPAEADAAISVYDTGSTHANADAEYDDPTLMIRVQHRDYDTGYAILYAIQRHLLNSLGMRIADWHYTGFWLLSGINRVGQDDQQREVFTLNLRAMREPAPPVDKSALLAALNAAAELDEEDYTPESWAVLAAAVSAGQIVYDDDAATQHQVDAATMAILDAIDRLVPAAPACAFPFDTSITAMLPGSLPLVISGADNQTISSPAPVDLVDGIYLAGTNVATPIAVDWPADEMRIVERVPVSLLSYEDVPLEIRTLHPSGLVSLGDGLGISFGVFWSSAASQRYQILPNALNWSGAGLGSLIQFDELPESISVGLTGDGHVYLIVEGAAYPVLTTTPEVAPWVMDVSAGIALVDFMQWATYSSTNITGQSTGQVLTDASQFQNTYPEIPGITKQADLCGTEIDTVSPFNEFQIVAGFLQTTSGENTERRWGYRSDPVVGSLIGTPYQKAAMTFLGNYQINEGMVFNLATFAGDCASAFDGMSLYIDDIEFEIFSATYYELGDVTEVGFVSLPGFVENETYTCEFRPSAP